MKKKMTVILSVIMLIGNMNFLYVNAEENEENPDQNDVTEFIVEKTEEEEEGISPSEEKQIIWRTILQIILT